MAELRAPSRIIPPVYFAIALAAIFGIDLIDMLPRWTAWPWRLMGMLLIFLGLGLAAHANYLFSKAGTDVKPFSSVTTLVTEGPYRYTRNPMYLGMVIVLTGTSVLLGGSMAFIVIPAFALFITHFFIRPEESLMEELFGDAFRDYRKRVRRWI